MTLISNTTTAPLIARRIPLLMYLMTVALLLLISSCHEDDSPAPKQAQIKVKVNSDGATYDAVYLDIQQLWTRTSAGGQVPHGSLQEVMLKIAPSGNRIVLHFSQDADTISLRTLYMFINSTSCSILI